MNEVQTKPEPTPEPTLQELMDVLERIARANEMQVEAIQQARWSLVEIGNHIGCLMQDMMNCR